MDYFSSYNTLDLITMVFDETESIISLLEEMEKTKLTNNEKEQIKTIMEAYSSNLTNGEKLLMFHGIEIGLKLYLTILEIRKERGN